MQIIIDTADTGITVRNKCFYFERAGTARHDAVAWGYARAADALGVDIIQNCEVTGIDIKNGKVTGVQTSRGAIKANRGKPDW